MVVAALLLFFAWNRLTLIMFRGDGDYRIVNGGFVGPLFTSHYLDFPQRELEPGQSLSYEFRGYDPYGDAPIVSLGIAGVSTEEVRTASFSVRGALYTKNRGAAIWEGFIDQSRYIPHQSRPNYSLAIFWPQPKQMDRWTSYELVVEMTSDSVSPDGASYEVGLSSGWK